MFDWLTTEVWDGIREWREFIRSLLYLDHRDHLCYIISFTLHGIGIGTYFVEERLTVLIHRWRFCQSIVDTLMKLTSVQLRFFADVHNLIGLEFHLCHEDDVAVI